MARIPPARIAFAALFVSASAPAIASDYTNVCRTADGAFEIDDGALRSVDAGGQQSEPIAYRTVRETIRVREAGYCLSDAAGSQKFHYEAKSTTLRAAFEASGRKLELDFTCEFVADGLPAAHNCDKRVVTASEIDGRPAPVKADGEAAPPPTAAATAPRAGTRASSRSEAQATSSRSDTSPTKPDHERGRTWMHNGSVMRQEVSGDERRFVYEAPRAGIRRVGAKPGTLLFKGTLEGSTYAGTAYVFSTDCPPQPFPVTGRVSDGGRRVVMTGKSPRISASCEVTGSRDDTLVFTWNP